MSLQTSEIKANIDKSFDQLQLKNQIIEAGRILDQKGLLPASSGNLSMRNNSDSALITVSGKSKGNLNHDDFVIVDLAGNPENPESKPSAETLLHTQLYKFSDEIQAVFHVHSINTVVISKLIGANKELRLKDYELLKALRGVDTHKHCELIPVFANTQNIKLLAKEVEQFMQTKPDIHAYLIEGHGLYSWGSSAEEALRNIEVFETLIEIELKLCQN